MKSRSAIGFLPLERFSIRRPAARKISDVKQRGLHPPDNGWIGHSAMAESDAIPTAREIEHQLERMLKSAAFSARPQQAKVFEFLVRAAVAQKEITEKDIRAKFFPTPPYNPDSTVVRTTVNFVRGSLVPGYYADEGAEDAVIVTLPLPVRAAKHAPGAAYRPEFAYNPRSAADHSYREGLRHFSHLFSFFDFAGAGRCFDRATAAQPSFAPAYAARAELHVAEPMLAPYIQPRKMLTRARTDALRALRLDPKQWRAHVALAAVHVCRRQWKEAQEEFNKALRLNRQETRLHPWYAAYLMAIGKKNEALALVSDRAVDRPEDPFALAIWGLFAYVQRDFATARQLLEKALSRNPKDWVACFASACLRLQGDTPDDGTGERLITRAHDLLEMDVFPGLRVLSLRSQAHPDKEILEEEIQSHAFNWQSHEYWSPFQMALGQIAYGENAEALQSLGEAFNDCNPYMAWLHLWPFLDRLRREKKFQRLVARMRLP
jgi:tetratricopeptide (TPR) repeat protein